MPIMYVNPRGKRRKTKKVVRRKVGPALKRAVARKFKTAKKRPKRKTNPRRIASATRRKKTMAKKRTVKRRRPVRRKTTTRRRVKRNPSKRSRSSAAKKAARTRAANKRKRSLAAKKGARKRARKNPAPKRRRRRRVAAKRVVRRRRRVARRNPAPKRRRRRRSVAKRVVRRRRLRRNPRASTGESMHRARQTIVNKKRKGLASAVAARFKMRSNPAGIKDAIMKALPIAAGFYGSKALAHLGAKYVPGLNKLQVGGIDLAKPVLSLGAIVVTHFGTKKVKALVKHRSSLMLGAGLNFIDVVVNAFAPQSVKEVLGLESGTVLTPLVTTQPTEGYVTVDDYVAQDGYFEVGENPIDDDITLGQIEADLGMFESEMGAFESEMGDFANRRLGGVSRSSMLSPVPARGSLAPIPSRSWTGAVPSIGPGFDQGLYRGIFKNS
ncbi:MAG: hypothetical protein Q8S00_32665 [Deltaproteobacteria bacterium]|nr:hypothetical protein [Deltaproteobacteria bacterium]